MKIHHIDCGRIQAENGPRACCHCLLIEAGDRLVLVDTGIGLQDAGRPEERIGREKIEAAGFKFDEDLAAARGIERLGRSVSSVTDIVVTHADPDHVGGLADFPQAAVHVSAEELAALEGGNPRYCPAQFAHGPRWVAHGTSGERLLGIEARPLPLGPEIEAWLVPLFGHTAGHCGVAVRDGGRTVLHAGDAYYLRAELSRDDLPVSALAAAWAVDDPARRRSLSELRRIEAEFDGRVVMFAYHDVGELPDEAG